jgi:hypothetical protein
MIIWSWRGLYEDCSAGDAEGSFWLRKGWTVGGADGDKGTGTVQALDLWCFGDMLTLSNS